jgi:hypothetical protein
MPRRTVTADAVLRNAAVQEALVRARKDTVCRALFPREYKAGDAAGAFVFRPERCARTLRKPAASAAPVPAPPRKKGSRSSAMAATLTPAELDRERAAVAAVWAADPAPPHTVVLPSEAPRPSALLYRVLVRMDVVYKYVVHAVIAMVAADSVRRQPDPVARLAGIRATWSNGAGAAQEWDGEIFEANRRVIDVLYKQYQSLYG